MSLTIFAYTSEHLMLHFRTDRSKSSTDAKTKQTICANVRVPKVENCNTHEDRNNNVALRAHYCLSFLNFLVPQTLCHLQLKISVLVSFVEGQKSVKWILIISIIMFLASMYYTLPYYYPSSERSFLDTVWYVLGRIVTLLFLATITTGTLFTTNFSKKELAYKLTLYLFIISMSLFFIQFLRMLFSIP